MELDIGGRYSKNRSPHIAEAAIMYRMKDSICSSTVCSIAHGEMLRLGGGIDFLCLLRCSLGSVW